MKFIALALLVGFLFGLPGVLVVVATALFIHR